VKYLFGDDLLCSPQALGRLVALLDADPRIVLAASARRIIDEHSRPVDVWNEFRAARRWAGTAVIGRCLEENYNLIGEPSAVLFRRAAASRGFNPQWRQLVDLEMWLDLLLQGDFAYDPEPLCAFRRHEQQQTVVNRRARVGPDEHLQLAVRHLKVFLTGANGRPEPMASAARSFASCITIGSTRFRRRKTTPPARCCSAGSPVRGISFAGPSTG